MTEQMFSMVIRGGTAVLPHGAVRADIGIRGETIAAIGEQLGPGANEIDASGRLVMPGGIGTLGWNTVRAPGTLNFDMDLIKRFRIHENKEFEFRLDAISILNHPNFGAPTMSLNSTSFGNITSALGSRSFILNTRVNF